MTFGCLNNPTNFEICYPQDIESIDALAEAIGEYDGGVIIVS